MIIIGYSEPDACESRYASWLSYLASNYRKEGMTWQEANKKAYEEIYAEYVYEATAYPRQTPQGWSIMRSALIVKQFEPKFRFNRFR